MRELSREQNWCVRSDAEALKWLQIGVQEWIEEFDKGTEWLSELDEIIEQVVVLDCDDKS